jgi:hypothetical protein
MGDAELVHIDLTDDERVLLVQGLNEYGGPGRGAPLLRPLVGLSSVGEFYYLIDRLKAAVKSDDLLSDLDWARALVLTEISWASDLLGAGIDFSSNIRDEKAVVVLRGLQRKISGHRFELLRDNAIRPLT